MPLRGCIPHVIILFNLDCPKPILNMGKGPRIVCDGLSIFLGWVFWVYVLHNVWSIFPRGHVAGCGVESGLRRHRVNKKSGMGF